MKKLFGIASVIVLFGVLSSNANANMRFSIVGAGTMPSASETTPPFGRSLKGGFGYGGGLLLGLPLGSHLEFETGGIYAQSKFDVTIGAATTSTTGWNVHVPLVFNYWFNRNIAITFGGFIDSGVGTLSSTGVPATLSYGDIGMSNLNYGLEGGIGFSFPMGSMSLIIDGRYAYGLKEMRLDTASGSTKISNMMGLVGLRFGGGK